MPRTRSFKGYKTVGGLVMLCLMLSILETFLPGSFPRSVPHTVITAIPLLYALCALVIMPMHPLNRFVLFILSLIFAANFEFALDYSVFLADSLLIPSFFLLIAGWWGHRRPKSYSDEKYRKRRKRTAITAAIGFVLLMAGLGYLLVLVTNASHFDYERDLLANLKIVSHKSQIISDRLLTLQEEDTLPQQEMVEEYKVSLEEQLDVLDKGIENLGAFNVPFRYRESHRACMNFYIAMRETYQEQLTLTNNDKLDEARRISINLPQHIGPALTAYYHELRKVGVPLPDDSELRFFQKIAETSNRLENRGISPIS